VTAVERVVDVLGRLRRDVWLALRRLARAPGFTLFAVATLGFGIGSTTVAYSVIYSGIWQSDGIADPERLAFITRSNSMNRASPASVSEDDVAAIRSGAQSFASVGAYTSFGTSFIGPAGTELAACQLVSGELFPMMGIQPVVGRFLGPADDQPGAPAAAVISEAMWRRQYAGDSKIVGRRFTLGSTVFEIVGVAPEGFTGPQHMPFREIGAWVPLSFAPAIDGTRGDDARVRRARAWLFAVVRLAPGVEFAKANAELALLADRQDRMMPLPPIPAAAGQPDAANRRLWLATPVRSGLRATDTNAGILIILLPGIVLLVACSNLANLVLSRGLARRHDLAVRRALGATRWRLMVDGLVEVAVVCGLGVAAGLLIAQALLVGGLTLLHDAIAAFAPSLEISLRLVPTAFGAAAAAGVLSVAIAGLVPMLQLSRGAANAALSVDTPDRSLPRWRGRGGLIAAQVAVSVGLFLITVIAVRGVISETRGRGTGEARLEVDAVSAAVIPFNYQGVNDQRARETTDAVIRELRRSPRVAAAGAGSNWPFMGSVNFSRRSWTMLTTPDRPFAPGRTIGVDTRMVTATPDLFRAVGLAAQSGRLFTDDDGQGAPPVVVLNRAAADRLASASMVGREVQYLLDTARYTRTSGKPTTVTVVGVVDDGERDGRGVPQSVIYLPASQQFDPGLVIIARAADGDAASVVQPLRSAIRTVDSTIATTYVGPAGLLTGGGMVAVRIMVGLAATLSAFALFLAMSGLYAVLSYVVAQRSREMGVRIALGADRRRILLMVLRGGLWPVIRGVVLGLGAAALVRKLMQMYFTFELSAIDPMAFALAALPILVAGVAACYLPARRASRVDPNVALRHL